MSHSGAPQCFSAHAWGGILGSSCSQSPALFSLKRDDGPHRYASNAPLGLHDLKFSFPLPPSTHAQLMLMSVLTCLFESLSHVLR